MNEILLSVGLDPVIIILFFWMRKDLTKLEDSFKRHEDKYHQL